MKSKKTLSMNLLFILFFGVFSFISCNKGTTADPEPPAPFVPAVNIQNASQIRVLNDTTMTFYLYLNKVTTVDVSVDYTLVNGSATAPKNYIATSGTITIPANQSQFGLKVTIKGDNPNLRQPNINFSVELSNPKNCTLTTTSATGTIITENGLYLPTDTTGYETPTSYAGYNLVWSDEFSGSALNSDYWTPETGNGNGGWGNNELEYYTGSTKNVFVSDGNLIIEARKEDYSSYHYTSARIKTQNKKEFQFGRIDIRAKLPSGQGIWPALWMLGSNISSVGWPACGEIDIMEYKGQEPTIVHGTMHWQGTLGGDVYKTALYYLNPGTFYDKFHVFSIVWEQDSIKWYIDDQLYLTGTKTDVGDANYPFNAYEFFIFNVAVGGNFLGSPDETTVFPQRMFVDYVRVFQKTTK